MPLRFLLPLMILISPAWGEGVFSLKDVEKEQYRSICMVKSGGGTGTGVYINGTTVLTAAHVVENEANIDCIFQDQTIHGERYTVCKYGADVAVVNLAQEPKGIPTQKIAVEALQVGDRVVMAGFDRANVDRLRVYDGVVDAVHSLTSDIRPIDAKISISGNSGGPVWNEHGEVVSVISTRCPAGTKISYSDGRVGYTEYGTSGVPSSDRVIDFIERCREKGFATAERIFSFRCPSGRWGGIPRGRSIPFQPKPKPVPPQPAPSNGCDCPSLDELVAAVLARIPEQDQINVDEIRATIMAEVNQQDNEILGVISDLDGEIERRISAPRYFKLRRINGLTDELISSESIKATTDPSEAEGVNFYEYPGKQIKK